jgi:hypothetical protein
VRQGANSPINSKAATGIVVWVSLSSLLQVMILCQSGANEDCLEISRALLYQNVVVRVIRAVVAFNAE